MTLLWTTSRKEIWLHLSTLTAVASAGRSAVRRIRSCGVPRPPTHSRTARGAGYPLLERRPPDLFTSAAGILGIRHGRLGCCVYPGRACPYRGKSCLGDGRDPNPPQPADWPDGVLPILSCAYGALVQPNACTGEITRQGSSHAVARADRRRAPPTAEL